MEIADAQGQRWQQRERYMDATVKKEEGGAARHETPGAGSLQRLSSKPCNTAILLQHTSYRPYGWTVNVSVRT
jgi:hypothetical protein